MLRTNTTLKELYIPVRVISKLERLLVVADFQVLGILMMSVIILCSQQSMEDLSLEAMVRFCDALKTNSSLVKVDLLVRCDSIDLID